MDLASPVVFVGPNNSGKSTAMQALVLWETGLRRWLEKGSRSKEASIRTGVALHRQDLAAMPVPKAKLLWRNLRVRDVRRVDGRQVTSNVRIEIVVEGTSGDSAWKCGLEFDYANEESFYCRPLRTGEDSGSPRMPVPSQACSVRMAFLTSIAGLAPTETLLAPGTVTVRIGEGRTAEVLRNLCLNVCEEQPEHWHALSERIEALFGVQIDAPKFRSDRGEITMAFREGDLELDISSAGRGLHQMLLLLAYMYARPASVLLLDEPDAHLEPLRKRQAYRTIREVARETGCQAIIATHSEVLLNEAADQDLALAFIGQPHQVGRQHSERFGRSLREFGFEHYMHAAQTGWVLYLSGPTDLAVLQGFAARLGHTASARALQRPFVHYVGDSLAAAIHHFRSLAGVLPEVRAFALLDDPQGTGNEASDPQGMARSRWKRGRIENYVCTRSALEGYASREGQTVAAGPLFAPDQSGRRLAAMRKAIKETAVADASDATGGSEEQALALEEVFRAYRSHLDATDRIPVPSPGDLVVDLPESEIDTEIQAKLDMIAIAAGSASGGVSS